jgi:hypothetical protein
MFLVSDHTGAMELRLRSARDPQGRLAMASEADFRIVCKNGQQEQPLRRNSSS